MIERNGTYAVVPEGAPFPVESQRQETPDEMLEIDSAICGNCEQIWTGTPKTFHEQEFAIVAQCPHCGSETVWIYENSRFRLDCIDPETYPSGWWFQ